MVFNMQLRQISLENVLMSGTKYKHILECNNGLLQDSMKKQRSRFHFLFSFNSNDNK